MNLPQINQLANLQEPLHLLEVEAIFTEVMELLQRKAPSKEECINFHIRFLHSQLLLPTQFAMDIVIEIEKCIIKFHLLDQQENWKPIIDLMKEFQNKNNQNSLNEEYVKERIITHARRLWHTKISDINFETIIGQKVIAVDFETNFIIELEKGALIIECPWRIRDVEGILLGQTDILYNKSEEKSVGEWLINKKIKDIQLLEQCPLLIIQLDHIFIDIFHASTYYDGWTLTDNGDFYIFSMHGGEIV